MKVGIRTPLPSGIILARGRGRLTRDLLRGIGSV